MLCTLKSITHAKYLPITFFKILVPLIHFTIIITYITLLDGSVKVSILISNTVFQSANSTCYYFFTPTNFIPIQNFYLYSPCPVPSKQKAMKCFYIRCCCFVLGKANDALILNMYKQKNLTDFKLLVERHSKQK